MLEAINHSRRNGVTLIEMMVVIAVLGILAAVALPSYTDAVERNRVRSAAEATLGLLQFARLESIKQNRSFQIVGENGANWCMAITNLGAAACACGTTCTFTTANGTTARFINSTEFRGITLAGLPSNPPIPVTTPSGMSIGGAAQLTLTGPTGIAATVRHTISGASSICGNNFPGLPTC